MFRLITVHKLKLITFKYQIWTKNIVVNFNFESREKEKNCNINEQAYFCEFTT